MNEPRNEHSNGTAEVQEWITNMAAHVKQYANQLVTIGQDGFYGRSNCMSEKCAPSPSTSISWTCTTRLAAKWIFFYLSCPESEQLRQRDALYMFRPADCVLQVSKNVWLLPGCDPCLHTCRVNPVPFGWPHETGQDFLPNHMADGIDFASMHL